ncbi:MULTISPECIES: DUF4062 domain-containing protein [Paraburkholderia]|uniref:DUF4062 domain-containing protein n=1 Tax=Paraburkholderia unamae TaxID=219649 RepID=A0ACC6RWJ4_9BURK
MEKKYQVFISSTYRDMKEERQAAVMSILSAGHIPAGMELFAAADVEQMDIIRRWIDESDIFVLILGGRYGSIDSTSGKSYIQLEYEYAVQTKKPLFALYLTEEMLDDKVRKQGRDMIEQDDTRAYKEFHSLVTGKLCAEVGHIKDINIEVPKAITALSRRHNLDGWIRASSVTAAPTAPLESVAQSNLSQHRVEWTQLIKVDASSGIPPSARIASIQYRLWSDIQGIPLLIRISSNAEGTMSQELSGPSGVAKVMVVDQQTFYVSFSHPMVQHEISVIGYEL